MTRDEFAKFLFDNRVYNALQFIDGAKSSILDARYYKDFILSISTDIVNENDQWRATWTIEHNSEDEKWSKLNMGEWPKFEMELFDTKVSKIRLRDMFIKGFFQSCRNAFDEMAQAANAACLASKSKRIETVDFPQMVKVFQQQTYSQAFPIMHGWFSQMDSSNEYNYIDLYCNRTKHTCSVKTNTNLPILGEGKSATIEPFSRQGSNDTTQIDRKEIVDYIQVSYVFIMNAYKEFFTALMQEVPKQTYVENRLFSVSVYQQKMKGSPDNSFSMAYVVENPDYASMPEQIEVMFVTENGESIHAMNCPFDIIYIRDKSNEHEYVGKYEAEGVIGEDALLRFRKYKKIAYDRNELPLQFQAMMDQKQKDVFYHCNPYVEITTVSDDDEFLKRVSLPF